MGHPDKFVSDRMTKYSTTHVFKTHLLGKKAAVFCGAAGNRFLFSNENKLVRTWRSTSLEKVMPASTNTSFNQVFNHMRSTLPDFINPKALQAYVPKMDHIARRHFADEWDNKHEVLVYPLTNKYTFHLALRLFLSIEDPLLVDRLAHPFYLIDCARVSIPIDLPGTPLRKGIKASKYVAKEMLSIIKQRRIDLAEGRASPTQDILSHMLHTRDDNGKLMHEMDIAGYMVALILVGFDTVNSLCTFVASYLAELPQIYHGVYKEQMEIAKSKAPGETVNMEDLKKMKYSWNVACEVMRLVPPVHGAFREAIVDFTYNGFSIPKGWKLLWSASWTHKSPEYFSEPHKFDPSRFEGSGPAPYTFVPFGGGPWMCPGKEYARLAILVFVHHLVKRFKWDKIIPDEKIVIAPVPVPAKGLPVRLYPHTKA